MALMNTSVIITTRSRKVEMKAKKKEIKEIVRKIEDVLEKERGEERRERERHNKSVLRIRNRHHIRLLT